MIILKGKYNIAKIMLPNEIEEYQVVLESGFKELHRRFKYLDDATKDQIQGFLNHPAFQGEPIIVMPDTHYGKGSCVGFTFEMNDYIIPNIVGVDIGCGVLATKLPVKYSVNGDISDFNLQDFDKFIRDNIPYGFNIHDVAKDWYLDEIDLEFACDTLGLDYKKVSKSVGTLGGGNHFIELGIDEEENIWLTIHSGSRNFGLQVANYYQSIADSNCKRYFQDFKELNFLIDDDLKEYLDLMSIAQHFANINRRTMTEIIMDKFFQNVNFLEQIDSVHNYIDFDDGIIRKGATPARNGQKVVIPFNMQDGLIIGTGKGNPDWNFSAPHGAGRILSRNKAKELLNLDEAKQGMKDAGIYTTSLTEGSLDEAKGAYKDKQLILDMIKDTVEVTKFVKPIYNFKDDSKRR